MVLELESNQTQVQRIIQSKAFRTSEVHRNLLQYLAEKSLSGGADALKEYTVGLDVFAKPESYDPRQESVVRMHVARLRQKLAEYYRSEGADDPILIEVPKGGFKVTFEVRAIPPEPLPVTAAVEAPQPSRSRKIEAVLGALLAVAGACALIFGFTLWHGRAAGEDRTGATAPVPVYGSAELQRLWGPILSTNRPLMVCLGSSHGVTGVGTASASFLLGQFLAHRKDNVLLTRSDLLSTPELIMDNVVFLGPATGNRQIQSITTGQQFVLEPNGIRNLHPQPGEPAFIPDRNPQAGEDADESHALISNLPGLYGNGDILYLSGNQISSTLAAVRALTDPTLARELIEKLKNPDGGLPRFYQVVLQVRSMDSMPIEISYLYHRDLTPQSLKPGK
ncbi:MAG TPA: hypothetical protein VME17_17515 [Bryobacteraceae bacterium]|nr:hypothetical protein [Bryobacteraceae bacterium]